MEEYLVSVIVPVYNSEKYIEESILSICRQTYKQIEIVIVDDGSTDRSIEIASEILKTHEMNFKIIRQENKGLPAARNTGINNSSGQYLCFIDSDDIILSNHISDLIEVVKSKGVDVAHSLFEYTKEGNRRGKLNKYASFCVTEKEEFLYNFVRRKPAVHCCSIMVKKSFLIDNSLVFNETLRKYGEDVEFMWRLFPRCRVVGCTGKYTYKYLVRDNSLMTVGKKEPWDIFLIEFTRTMDEEKKECLNLSKYYSWAYYRTLVGLLRIVAESTDYKTFELYKRKIVTKEMIDSLKSFPDNKVKIVFGILKNNDKLYYSIYRRRCRLI